MSEHIVHFHCGVDQTSTEHFRDRCLEAIGKGATGLLLNLSTAGGSTALGFTLYNFLKSLHVPIRALNSGNIESMGIVMYLAAQERIVCPHSRFLIHPMSWYFNQSSVDHSRIREYLRSLDNDLQRYVNIYLSETEGASQPLDIGRCLSSEEKVIRAEDSIACGIAHRVEQLRFDEHAVHWTVSGS
ncbi:ATP-dependent Clp protease proteolytic subunit [Pseudomonas sp. NPDC088444]|uniref:ATP-dependent Clp protease proteolytic subunit n=1 Tax=Pseudomonas sp. NPDC088444 TaxID=3364456 RepID=UPI00384BB8A1